MHVTRETAKIAAPIRPDRLLVALAVAAVCIRALFQFFTHVTFEDSLISLRYAENLAAGLGMVYNPGERVFGASTPLYVLLLAGLTRLGLPALAIAKGLAATADGITLYLWCRWLLRRVGNLHAALVFALLFGLSPLMVHVSVSGMESAFAVLLLSLALLADLEDRPTRCGAALGVLMLVRPDGALAALLILGLRWHRTKVLPWKPALLAAAIVLPWLVIATLYYGSPLPHSIPAKAAAYNLHRTSIMPGLRGTLAQFFPFSGSVGQIATAAMIALLLAAGITAAAKDARLRTVAALFVTWWAYLVLPRTLIFAWYFPLLLLPVYVLAAYGIAALESGAVKLRGRPWREEWSGPLTVALALALVCWLGWAGYGARRIQRAEESVRMPIGLWLRDHVPPGTRVAMEPIGYIGYYSRAHVLDEVGLISPELVPLNRVGDGWFSAMTTQYRPEFIVERPNYLIFNKTLNSGVRMFGSLKDRARFVEEYEPVAEFDNSNVPRTLVQDYRFVIYRRRSEEGRAAWRARWAAAHPDDRYQLLIEELAFPETRATPPDAPRAVLRQP